MEMRSQICNAIRLPLDEELYCDFCCQPLQCVYVVTCGHRYCKQCLIEIYAHENVALTVQNGELQISSVVSAFNLSGGHAAPLKESTQVMYSLQFTEPYRSYNVLAEQKRPYTSRYVHCPLCLARICDFYKTDVKRAFLCQNCGEGKREVRCADCRAELCRKCDGSLHSFNLLKTHTRQLIASADAFHEPQSDALTEGALNSSTAGSRADFCEASEHTGALQPAEFYCAEKGRFVCCKCAALPHYRNLRCPEITQAAQYARRRFAETTEKCRKLIASARPLALQFDCIAEYNYKQLEERVNTARVVRDALILQIQHKFEDLEAQYVKMTAVRQQSTQYSSYHLCALLKALADAQVSAEKSILNAKDTTFLLEFEDRFARTARYLAYTEESLQKMAISETKAMPELDYVMQLQQAISGVCLDAKGVILEHNYGLHYKTCCRGCGNVLLDKEITDIAVLYKGNLLGVKNEDLAPGGIILDPKLGTPQSRHVHCRACRKELGRWSEPHCENPKFSVGFVFFNCGTIK